METKATAVTPPRRVDVPPAVEVGESASRLQFAGSLITPACPPPPPPPPLPLLVAPLIWSHSVVHDPANQEIKIDITHPSPPHSDKIIVDDVFVPVELRGHGRGRSLARRFLAECASRGLRVEYSEKTAPFFKRLAEEDAKKAAAALKGADPRVK